jgi:hypothetical protein
MVIDFLLWLMFLRFSAFWTIWQINMWYLRRGERRRGDMEASKGDEGGAASPDRPADLASVGSLSTGKPSSSSQCISLSHFLFVPRLNHAWASRDVVCVLWDVAPARRLPLTSSDPPTRPTRVGFQSCSPTPAIAGLLREPYRAARPPFPPRPKKLAEGVRSAEESIFVRERLRWAWLFSSSSLSVFHFLVTWLTIVKYYWPLLADTLYLRFWFV